MNKRMKILTGDWEAGILTLSGMPKDFVLSAREVIVIESEELEQLEAENKSLTKRIEELEAALQKIDNWAKAYPLEVFPEPDFKKAHKVLKAAGISLDAISASNMRHVISGVRDITSPERRLE